MVGLLRDVTRAVPSHFRAAGDRIVLLGDGAGHLGGSSYWEVVRGFVGGPPPPVDLAAEARLQRLLVAAAERRWLRSAHDCADGGLAVALAEACIGAPYAGATFGAQVELPAPGDASAEALLYGEDAGRVIVSCEGSDLPALLALAAEHGVPAAELGRVGPADGPLEIGLPRRGTSFSWPTRELRRIYFDAIPRRMRTDG